MISFNASSAVPIGQFERIFHALLFEITLLLIEAALVLAFSSAAVVTVSLLVVAMSTTAMLWNYLFNLLFDHLFGQDRLARTVLMRLAHSLLFELALVVVTTPMIMYALQLAWLEAMLSSAGLSLLALIYVFAFNWSFDLLRVRIVGPYPAGRAPDMGRP